MNASLLFLVGPTGVGKTAVGIELCARLDGEIISADSMQIYRGLDIGSAKPTSEEQQRARHHLINIREPHENYSAAQWAQDASCAIEEIRGRKKQPIVVGGTGFYMRALLQPQTLANVARDCDLRAQLEAEAAQLGAEHLHARLLVLDEAAAKRLHPNDVRRVIRALEVALSQNVESNEIHNGIKSFRVFGLQMERAALYARLESRIETMLQNGFMDELRALSQRGIAPDATAMQAVGYRQMWPALSTEELFDECVELWKRDTRRYAKRQMTWFRHQLPTQWFNVTEDSQPADIAQQIANVWHSD